MIRVLFSRASQRGRLSGRLEKKQKDTHIFSYMAIISFSGFKYKGHVALMRQKENCSYPMIRAAENMRAVFYKAGTSPLRR